MAQEQALNLLASFGPLALLALLVVNRLGAPTWASVLLVAAGTLAQRGVVNTVAAVLCAILGLMVGDLLAYSLGRQSVHRLMQRWERRQLVQQARRTLERHSGLAIVSSRFLFLFLAVPINFLASSMQVGRGRFLLFASLGNAIFVLVYFSLGYVGSGNWNRLWYAFARVPGSAYALAGVVGAALALFAWLAQRRLQRRRKRASETNPRH